MINKNQMSDTPKNQQIITYKCSGASNTVMQVFQYIYLLDELKI